MAMAILLALQAPAAGGDPVPVDFDLARLAAAERRGCDRGDADAIVVCGRRDPGGAFPMEEMARRYARRPLVAETDLGNGVTGRTYLEAYPLDRGAVSNRIMVGVRIPF